MIDFEIWLKLGWFHLTATPKNIALIRIRNGIFYYLIDWHKPEPKTKRNPTIDGDSYPIPF